MRLETKLNCHSNYKLSIRKDILNWYDVYGRKKLPWKCKDIYKIWISEIMLQQTQVSTVVPYYQKFIQTYPSLKKLLTADLNDILRLWSGLGFYRRAENIYKSCLIIKSEHNSKFPKEYSDILKLPGIGRTTASAILTFSRNGNYTILDGNVKRFLSRLFNVDNMDNEKKYLDILWKYSEELLPSNRADDFIQAYMDIGSLVCKKHLPLCSICPVREKCLSFKNGKEHKYTHKKTKIKIKNREVWIIFLINRDRDFYLEKISFENLWHGLYSSPIFENKAKLDNWLIKHNLEKYLKNEVWSFTHKLSHINFSFNTIFCKIKSKKKISLSDDNWYNLSNIDFGIPKYQDKIINKYMSKNDYN